MECNETEGGGGGDIHIISNSNALLTTLQLIPWSCTVFCDRFGRLKEACMDLLISFPKKST